MVYSGFHGTRRFLSPFGKLKLDLDLAAQDFEPPPTALMYVFAKQKPILIKVLFAWGSVLSLSGSLSLWIALGVCLFLSRCVCLSLSLRACPAPLRGRKVEILTRRVIRETRSC